MDQVQIGMHVIKISENTLQDGVTNFMSTKIKCGKKWTHLKNKSMTIRNENLHYFKPICIVW